MSDTAAAAAAVLRAIEAQDWDAIRALCAPDYVHHAPSVPSADVETYIATLKVVPQAMPDLDIAVAQIIPTDEYATMRYTVHGTLTGDFHGLAPTGAEISLPVLGLVHVVDGRLVEGWYAFDSAEIMRQAKAGEARRT